MRNRLISLLCGLAAASSMFVVSAGAAGAAPARQSKADIAVLLPDSKSSVRWETVDRKYLQAAFDAAGVTANIVNAQGDAPTQVTQADAAITNGAKVILLVDLDKGSGATIIAHARAAKVAVIDYDRLTIAGPGADFYVSFDGVAVGKVQGQGLVDAITAAGIKTPRVAILNGSPDDNNATLFSQGGHAILDPLFTAKTYSKVAEQAVPKWDNQQALTIFEQMLTSSNNGIDAVLAANDGLANSVISALKNANLKPIPLTGQDATVAGIQNILAGWQSMSVYKAVKQEANAAAALAIALDKGTDTSKLTTGTVDNTDGGNNAVGNKAIPAVLLTPVSVTKANIADTVIADGYDSWADICVGDFAQYCPAGALTAPATMAATASQ